MYVWVISRIALISLDGDFPAIQVGDDPVEVSGLYISPEKTGIVCNPRKIWDPG